MNPPKRTVLWAFWEGEIMLLSKARKKGMEQTYWWVNYDAIEKSNRVEYRIRCREHKRRMKLKAMEHQIFLRSPIDYP